MRFRCEAGRGTYLQSGKKLLHDHYPATVILRPLRGSPIEQVVIVVTGLVKQLPCGGVTVLEFTPEQVAEAATTFPASRVEEVRWVLPDAEGNYDLPD